MPFHDALFVLVLAPEAYLPLRALGANYHASADGMRAAEQVFELLGGADAERRPGRRSGRVTPSLEISGLTVTYGGRRLPALDRAELVVRPGETVALTGPSGCGKSTLLAVVLGLRVPDAGTVRLGGVDLADVDLADWRSLLAWVPQRPHLFARSVAENVRLGRPDASDADVAAALDDRWTDRGRAAAAAKASTTLLGEGGAGLSAGERQRLALARAFVRDAPLLLLDEPTASLDGETEADVLAAVARGWPRAAPR